MSTVDGQPKAKILTLPNELLAKILCTAAPVVNLEGHWPIHVYKNAVSLSYVCKRFHRIMISQIYSDINLDFRDRNFGPKGRISSDHLYRSCRENPSLYTLCRTLQIIYGVCPEQSGFNIQSMVAQFTAVRSFTLYGLNVGDSAWNLLSLACTNMGYGVELGLGSHPYTYDLNISCVVEALGSFDAPFLQRLQKLKLSGVSAEKCDLTQLKKFAGTAPFTKLELHAFLQGPEALQALTEWPRCLEEFKLEFTYGDDYCHEGADESWSLAKLQQILDPHRRSLRSLKVNAINEGTLEGFGLHAFERLEELGLGTQFTGHHSHRDAGNRHLLCEVLPPGLRLFHWDLSWLDQQHSEGLQDFSQWEEQWMRVFVRGARKLGCPLERIHITFRPSYVETTNTPTLGAYPWDRMDRMGVELGIEVSYNVPTIGRREYTRIVEGYLNH